MTRNEYAAYRRSIRDNGLGYTLRHASERDGATLTKLNTLARAQDMLAWRVQWLSRPDTDRASIIRLSSFIR